MSGRFLSISLLFLCSCMGNIEKNIFCDLTIRANVSDGRNIVTMTVDESLAGSIIMNLNTSQDFDYPVFVNGKGEVRLLKGVYMMAFDADATFEDGSTGRVRCSQYNSPDKTISLTGDSEEITLELYYIN